MGVVEKDLRADSLSQAGLRPELGPYSTPPPSSFCAPQAAPGQSLCSLFQIGRQSILQVNTAINNGVRRPGKEGGEASGGVSPPGPELQD